MSDAPNNILKRLQRRTDTPLDTNRDRYKRRVMSARSPRNSLEASDEEDECISALIELERQCGISADMERAWNNVSGTWKVEWVRETYFSVEDLKTRKPLIALFRKREDLRRERYRLEVLEATAALEKARQSDRHWWLIAGASAALLILFGNHFFQLPGAIAGAVIGLFLGRQIEVEAGRKRRSWIEGARSDLKEAQDTFVTFQKELPTFSTDEELTGVRQSDGVAD
jgi:hypothetical protein